MVKEAAVRPAANGSSGGGSGQAGVAAACWRLVRSCGMSSALRVLCARPHTTRLRAEAPPCVPMLPCRRVSTAPEQLGRAADAIVCAEKREGATSRKRRAVALRSLRGLLPRCAVQITGPQLAAPNPAMAAQDTHALQPPVHGMRAVKVHQAALIETGSATAVVSFRYIYSRKLLPPSSHRPHHELPAPAAGTAGAPIPWRVGPPTALLRRQGAAVGQHCRCRHPAAAAAATHPGPPAAGLCPPAAACRRSCSWQAEQRVSGRLAAAGPAAIGPRRQRRRALQRGGESCCGSRFWQLGIGCLPYAACSLLNAG